jgi:hypothetical protein
VEAPELSALARELLEACYLDAAGGETTRALQVSLLAEPIERPELEATLRSLVERGLMTSWRGTFAGAERDRTGTVRTVDYVDDWWVVTDAGRAAIGLPPAREARSESWMNPSSGAWRVPAMLAPWSARRVARGKPVLPLLVARLLRKPHLGQDARGARGPAPER